MYYDPVTREYYDDPSDEEDIQGDYAPNDEHARSAHRALYAYARPLGGAPFFPPTVCHSGCRTLAHRIPSGGLPSGASLGVSHRIAVEERICLTHVPGGCFDGGICERLNTVNSVDTCIELGYHGRQFQCQRQVLRVAAGLSPGPPDDDDAANAAGGNHEERVYGPRPSRYSAGASGREHHGQHEAQRQRPRDPQGYTEELTEPGPSMGRRPGLGLREPPRGFVLPDEVEDPDNINNFEGNSPVGGRERRPYANHAADLGGLPQGDHRHHAVPPAAGPSGRHRRAEGGYGGGRGDSSGGYGQGSSGHDVVSRRYEFESQGRRG